MSSHSHMYADLKAAIAVLTVSDSRTEEDDRSGAAMRRMLEEAGHEVFDYGIVPDEHDLVKERVASWLTSERCDGVLVNGGTGISPRDRTYEAVSSLLDRRLDGFGELFRMLSYREIGSSAMMSRAIGGIASGRVLFSVPGSPKAVALAMRELIVPELGHLLGELRKE